MPRARRYNSAHDGRQDLEITAPFLIVHAEEDRVVPVASAHRLYEAVARRAST